MLRNSDACVAVASTVFVFERRTPKAFGATAKTWLAQPPLQPESTVQSSSDSIHRCASQISQGVPGQSKSFPAALDEGRSLIGASKESRSAICQVRVPINTEIPQAQQHCGECEKKRTDQERAGRAANAVLRYAKITARRYGSPGSLTSAGPE